MISEVFMKLIPMLNVFIPHAAEEMWELLGRKDSLYTHPWPDYSEELTVRDEIEIVFQINGKIRSKAQASASISRDEMEKLALEDPRIQEMTAGKQIIKKIVVPGKLVNIVIKG